MSLAGAQGAGCSGKMRPSQTMPQLYYTRQDIQEQYLATTPSRRPQAYATQICGGQQRARSSDPRRRPEEDSDNEEEGEEGEEEEEDAGASTTNSNGQNNNNNAEAASSKRQARAKRRKKRCRSHSASLFSGCFNLPHLASMLPSGDRADRGRSFLSRHFTSLARHQPQQQRRPISASQTAGNLQLGAEEPPAQQQQQERARQKHVSFGQRHPQPFQQAQSGQYQQQAQVSAASATVASAQASAPSRQPLGQRPSCNHQAQAQAQAQGSSVIMRNYQQLPAGASSVAPPPGEQSPIYLVSQVPGEPAAKSNLAAQHHYLPPPPNPQPFGPISAGKLAAPNGSPTNQPGAIYKLRTVPTRTQATQTDITAYHLMATPTLSNSPASSSTATSRLAPVECLADSKRGLSGSSSTTAPKPARASRSRRAQPSATDAPGGSAPKQAYGGDEDEEEEEDNDEEDDNEWSAAGEEEEEEDRRGYGLASSKAPSSSSSSATSLVGHDQTLAEAVATFARDQLQQRCGADADASSRQTDKQPETMGPSSDIASAAGERKRASIMEAGQSRSENDNKPLEEPPEPPSEFKDVSRVRESEFACAAGLESAESHEASSQTEELVLPRMVSKRDQEQGLGNSDDDDATLGDLLNDEPDLFPASAATQVPPPTPAAHHQVQEVTSWRRQHRFSSPAEQRRDDFLALGSSQALAAPPSAGPEPSQAACSSSQDSKRSSTSTLSARHHSYCSTDDFLGDHQSIALMATEQALEQGPRELELDVGPKFGLEPEMRIGGNEDDNHNQNGPKPPLASNRSPLECKDLLAAANGPAAAGSGGDDVGATCATIKLDCSSSSPCSTTSSSPTTSNGPAGESHGAWQPTAPSSRHLDETEMAWRLCGQVLEEAASASVARSTATAGARDCQDDCAQQVFTDTEIVNEIEADTRTKAPARQRSGGSPPTTVSELDEEEELSTPSFVDSYRQRLGQVRQVADSLLEQLMAELSSGEGNDNNGSPNRTDHEQDSHCSSSSTTSTNTTSLSGATQPCCHPPGQPHLPCAGKKPEPPVKPAHLRPKESAGVEQQTHLRLEGERPAAAAIAVTATSIAAAALLHTSYRPPTRLWSGHQRCGQKEQQQELEQEQYGSQEEAGSSDNGSGSADGERVWAATDRSKGDENKGDCSDSGGALVAQESRESPPSSPLSSVVAAASQGDGDDVGQCWPSQHSTGSPSSPAISPMASDAELGPVSGTLQASCSERSHDKDTAESPVASLELSTVSEASEEVSLAATIATRDNDEPQVRSTCGSSAERARGGRLASLEREPSEAEAGSQQMDAAGAAVAVGGVLEPLEPLKSLVMAPKAPEQLIFLSAGDREQRRRSAGATANLNTSVAACPPGYVRGDLAPPPCSPPPLILAAASPAAAARRLSHDDTMEAIEDDVEGEELEAAAAFEILQLAETPPPPPPAFFASSESRTESGLRTVTPSDSIQEEDEESSISVSQHGVLVQSVVARSSSSSNSSNTSNSTPTHSIPEPEQGHEESAELVTSNKLVAKTSSTESATEAILEHLSRHQLAQAETELPFDEPEPILEQSQSVMLAALDGNQAFTRRESWRRESPSLKPASEDVESLDNDKDSAANEEVEEEEQLEQLAVGATGTIKRRKPPAASAPTEVRKEPLRTPPSEPQRRGPPLAQLKASAKTETTNSLADTSICSSCSCMDPAPEEAPTSSSSPLSQKCPVTSKANLKQESGSREASSRSGQQWMSQEEGTVFTENYWLAHWLYISEHEEAEIWRRAIDMSSSRPAEAEERDDENSGGSTGMPESMSETSSTSSERNFSIKYKSTTRKMIHRRAALEMYKRMVQNNLKGEKRVEISRSNGEFGFRIHGSRPVVVSAIERGTSAETCGLQVGDLIYAINGTNILDMAHSEVVKLAHSADSSALVLDLVPTNGFLASARYQQPSNTAGSRHGSVVRGCLMRLSPGTAQPLLVELQEQVAREPRVSTQQRAQRLNEVMRRAWRRRHFVLRNDNCLYWYRLAQDIEPLGGVNLQGFSASLTNEFNEPTYVIRLVKYGQQPHYLGTNNICDIQTWIDAINKAATEANQNDPYMRRTLTLARTRPSQIPEPDCAGYLYKFSHKRGGGAHWRAAYFVLKDACLYLFRDQQADSVAQASAVYYLHGYRVRNKHIEQKKFTFELIPPNRKTIRPMFLMANSELDRKRWIAALEYSIDRWLEIA